MMLPEFTFQIDRLIKTFGKAPYPEERSLMIFSEISDLPIQWMIRTVDHFIGCSRSAPLLPEFKSEADKHRRFQEHTRAKDGPLNGELGPSVFEPDDTRMMFKMLIKKMDHKVSDAEWTEFVNFVKSRVAESPQMRNYHCTICFDKGTEFYDKNVDGRTYSYARNCRCGQAS